MAKVHLAPAFQKITGKKTIEIKSVTIKEMIDELEINFPGMKKKILSDTNQVYNYVTIFLEKEDVKYLQGLKTKISPSDQINILVAIAGG